MFLIPSIGWNADAAIVATYIASYSNTVSDTTTKTFNSVDIGAAASDRVIVVAVAGGVDAPLIVDRVSLNGIYLETCDWPRFDTSDVGLGIYYGKVTTGTTATVVARFTQSVDNGAIALWRVTGLKTLTPYDTAFNGPISTSPQANTLQIPYRGIGIGASAFGDGDPGTTAWTNLTEDFDLELTGGADNVIFSGGHDYTGNNVLSRSAALSSGDPTWQSGLVLASWGKRPTQAYIHSFQNDNNTTIDPTQLSLAWNPDNAGFNHGSQIIPGDLLVWNNTAQSSGSTIPADVAPTGFTSIGSVTGANTRNTAYYKIAVAGDGIATEAGGNGLWTGMNGATGETILLGVVRGTDGKKFTSISASAITSQVAGSAEPTPQTLPASGGTGTVLGVTLAVSNMGQQESGYTTSIRPDKIFPLSNTWDASFYFQGENPQNYTWDMDDSGNQNTLLGYYLHNFQMTTAPVYFVDYVTDQVDTLTLMNNIRPGDLLVWVHRGITGGSPPSEVTPTGFTLIGSTTGQASRVSAFYKIAVGTESLTTLSGINASATENLCCFQFRKGAGMTGSGISSVSVSSIITSGVTSADPATQTMTASGATAPVICFNTFISNNPVNPRTTSTQPDMEVFMGSDSQTPIHMRVQNTAANYTWDMEDEGSDNCLFGFYIHNIQ